jgi:hypothetical protein
MTIYLTPPSGGGGGSVASGTTAAEGTVRLATAVEAQDVNNETLAVTPKALNAQISASVAGGVTYQGVIAGDDITTLTSATQGDLYKISVASTGVVAGFNWDVNDNLLINADMGGNFDAAKVNKIDSTDSDLATVATSGSYNDLTNKPPIPSASTDLSDTASLVRSADLATVATTGAYSDLTGQPTDLGQFNNDQGYITSVASASETVAGIIEIATDLEAQAATVTDKALVPSNIPDIALSSFNDDLTYLSSVASASTTTAGIIEIADPTETSAGTSNALAVSPLGLATELGNLASTDLSDTAALVRTTDLATVATSGDYNDLSNTPTSSAGYPVQTSVGGVDETGAGGSDNSTSATLNTALVLTAASANDVEVKLPLISTASDGDVVIILRARAGSLKITRNDSETVSGAISYMDQGNSNSVTLTNNQQQIHVRFDAAGGGRWFIFDKAQAVVATTGSYNDLLNKPPIPSSSDDLTSDHDPTNYTGALDGSLTTHLAGIDTALGNALSGTTDSILEGQAKVETIDTGADARIEFSADPNGTGTEKIWEFNSSGHLIPNVDDTYDIGSAQKKVRDLYLGSSTLYMGGTLSLGIVSGNLRLSGGGSLEVGTAAVITDATLPSIPTESSDLTDGGDLLKTSDKGTSVGDLVEVVDVGSSVAGISALDGRNLTNLTYANITGTPSLATVATSGDYNDLSNKPPLGTAAELDTGTGIGEVVIMENVGGSAKLPQLDGSQLTGITATDSTKLAIANDLSDLNNAITARGHLGLGTSATLDHGTGANELVKLDGSSKLPAVDGSNLTNVGKFIGYSVASSGPLAMFKNRGYQLSANNITLTLPARSTLTDGDYVAITSAASYTVSIALNAADSGTSNIFYNVGTASHSTTSHTMTINKQEVFVRFNGSSFLITSETKIADVVSDTSPQLGGNLDVNANEIISASNNNVTLRPNGIGIVKLGGNTNPAELRFYCETTDQHWVGFKAPTHNELQGKSSISWRLPIEDASTPGDALVSDGSGNLSFTTISSGGGYTYSAITANPTGGAQYDYHYSCTGTFTLVLPAVGPSDVGKEIRVKNMGTGTITVDGNGTATIDAQQTIDLDVRYSSITLVATGDTSASWEIV